MKNKITRNKAHYLGLLSRNPNASMVYTMGAKAVYASRYGNAEQNAINRNHYQYAAIARDLFARYGETMSTVEVRREMDKEW